MDLKDETPSKSSNHTMNKVLSNPLSCDSPFRRLPNTSTPPSRFAKILNPFEQHLIERLHLPTFSPTVFAQVSTPKTDEKFRWTIDDISSLKPADIDEATISQHVSDHDPTIESLVQEKIDKFFKDKVIVPSPMSAEVQRIPLITTPPSAVVLKLKVADGIAQTVLSLPPVLPDQLEELLKPYFNYHSDQQQKTQNEDQDAFLYRQLFEFEDNDRENDTPKSVESSPAISTGLSPIHFSPNFGSGSPDRRKFHGSNDEFPDCTLSPISRSPNSILRESRSACRLNFSSHMSIDASLIVPDVNHQIKRSRSESFLSNEDNMSPPNELLSNSTNNWDMEYKHVSILSRSPVSSPELVDTSSANTPHSRIFPSQRKRLSDSFKGEVEPEKDIEMLDNDENVPKRIKNQIVSDVTDTGYHTGESSTWNGSHMFASTPTKSKNN